MALTRVYRIALGNRTPSHFGSINAVNYSHLLEAVVARATSAGVETALSRVDAMKALSVVATSIGNFTLRTTRISASSLGK